MVNDFIVKLDCSKARFMKSDAAVFGERNKGIPCGAENAKQAIAAVNAALGNKYNPFYLKAEQKTFNK